MALLFIDSFDHYDSPSILDKWTTNFTSSAIGVGIGRCGTNALKMTTFNQLHKGVPFAGPSGTVGFAVWVESGATLTNSVIAVSTFRGSSDQAHLSLLYHASDGSLSVTRSSGSGAVELGRTPPDTIRQDTWYFVEWQTTIGAAGAVGVRVNNVALLALTGVNTVGDGGTPYPADLRSVSFHCSSNQAWRMDDLYITDATGPAPQNGYLGDCRVEYLRPRAAGAAQEWTVVGAADHFFAVDDRAIPDEDATYVTSSTPGQTDTNRYQPTGLPSGAIFGAQLSLHTRKSDIGPRVVAPIVNGTQGPPNFSPSWQTYSYHHTMYPTNPATGAAWTIAEINAIDAGMKVVS